MPDASELVAANAGDRFSPREACAISCARALRRAVEVRDGVFFVRITPSLTCLLSDLTAAEANLILDS